ncbi:hypothetical protein BDV93DRAFT_516712, partial [Ceratobasidium sp. AG-I]
NVRISVLHTELAKKKPRQNSSDKPAAYGQMHLILVWQKLHSGEAKANSQKVHSLALNETEDLLGAEELCEVDVDNSDLRRVFDIHPELGRARALLVYSLVYSSSFVTNEAERGECNERGNIKINDLFRAFDTEAVGVAMIPESGTPLCIATVALPTAGVLGLLNCDWFE